MVCIFCDRLLSSDLCIFEQKLTKTFVNYNQACEGLLIVMLKKHLEDEALLSEAERAEFFKEATKVGQILKKIYSADRINYMLLGNEIPHLHWHVIPRTTRSIKENYFPIQFLNKKMLTEKQEKQFAEDLRTKFSCTKL